jgi:hypothetical protein
MFYYIAAEQEMARGEDTNDLGPSTINTINSSLRNYLPLANLHLQSGFFPTTDQETELSGRIDRTLTRERPSCCGMPLPTAATSTTPFIPTS